MSTEYRYQNFIAWRQFKSCGKYKAKINGALVFNIHNYKESSRLLLA